MEEQKKYERISVAKGIISLLSTEYGVSTITVYNALAGRSNSDKAKNIREMAMSRYGGRISTIQVF